METEKAIIIFNILKTGLKVDLEVPLDISANDLINSLNSAYNLEIDTLNIKSCYLISENPIALLRGNKTLAEFGIRNGSIIYYTR